MKRGLRIAFFTLSLYRATHTLVLIFLPLGLVLAAMHHRNALQRLKARFVDSVFRVVGQKAYVSGLQHL